MDKKELDRRITIMGIRPESLTARACFLVLVKNLSRHEAARRVGINVSSVSRAVAKLQADACPCCGQAV